ncbi:hypothetical protein BASA81_010599 [Batrachochytrium salamandrivorans]|nr:hypothetical protein BASA81_010599 [Batrachochytrium salamandrivorans]
MCPSPHWRLSTTLLASAAYVPFSPLFPPHTNTPPQTNIATLRGASTMKVGDGSPVMVYLGGIVAPAIIMIVFFLIWVCCLSCVKLVFKTNRHRKLCLAIFTVASLLSILGWVIGLAGNSGSTQAFDQVSDGLVRVQTLLGGIIQTSNGTANLASGVSQMTVAVVGYCNANSAFTTPYDRTADATRMTYVQAYALSPDAVIDSVGNLATQLDKLVDTLEPLLAWRETAAAVILALLLASVLVFFPCTVMRETRCAPNALAKTVRLSSKGSSMVLFFFGILLLLLLWIVIAIVHVIVTAGADVCAPDVNYSLNRILAESYFTNTSLEEIREMDFCHNATYLAAKSTHATACYYQTCSGPNGLQTAFTTAAGLFTQTQANLAAFKAQYLADAVVQAGVLASPALAGADALCKQYLDYTIGNATYGIAVATSGNGLVSCDVVNPAYSKIVYNGMCNAIIDYMYMFYLSSILGSLSLMIALMAFRTFQFVDPKTVEQNGQMANGQVVSSGGPATKEYA